MYSAAIICSAAPTSLYYQLCTNSNICECILAGGVVHTQPQRSSNAIKQR